MRDNIWHQQAAPVYLQGVPVGYSVNGLLYRPRDKVYRIAADFQMTWDPALPLNLVMHGLDDEPIPTIHRHGQHTGLNKQRSEHWEVNQGSSCNSLDFCILPEQTAVVSEVILILLQQEQGEPLLAVPHTHCRTDFVAYRAVFTVYAVQALSLHCMS